MKLRTKRLGELCLRRGMTLVELSVMVSVLLVIVTILLVGASAWKSGADRSNCVLNIRQMQVAVRSYANFRTFQEGQDVSPENLSEVLIGTESYFAKPPLCPANGIYNLGGNTIPLQGTLYMTCSLAPTKDHEPDNYAQW